MSTLNCARGARAGAGARARDPRWCRAGRGRPARQRVCPLPGVRRGAHRGRRRAPAARARGRAAGRVRGRARSAASATTRGGRAGGGSRRSPRSRLRSRSSASRSSASSTSGDDTSTAARSRRRRSQVRPMAGRGGDRGRPGRPPRVGVRVRRHGVAIAVDYGVAPGDYHVEVVHRPTGAADVIGDHEHRGNRGSWTGRSEPALDDRAHDRAGRRHRHRGVSRDGPRG